MISYISQRCKWLSKHKQYLLQKCSWGGASVKKLQCVCICTYLVTSHITHTHLQLTPSIFLPLPPSSLPAPHHLGCLFLQESSGFLFFPFRWHFFHRNQDSCSAVTFFYPLRNPVCTGPTYVAVGSYVGLEKEQS